MRCNMTTSWAVLLCAMLLFNFSNSSIYLDSDGIFLGDDVLKAQSCYDGTGYVRLDPSEKYEHRSMLERQPPTFLQMFKNPCWLECMPKNKDAVYPEDSRYWKPVSYQRFKPNLEKLRDEVAESKRKWRVRCLPKFYLIGWLKCGSTDLFSRLITHPDVLTMSGKEVRFWSGKLISNNGVYALERYLDVADIATREIVNTMRYNSTSKQFYHPYIFGDGTPSDIFQNTQWYSETMEEMRIAHESGQSEEDVTFMWTPKFLRHLQPKAKFVIILRNPVTMTYSAYKFFTRPGSEKVLSPEHFHQCVVGSIKTFLECEDNHSSGYCSYAPTSVFNYTTDMKFCNYVAKNIQYGRFYVYIKDWLKYFDISQFFIIRMERYSKHQHETIVNLWDFLDLEPLGYPERRHLVHSGEKLNSIDPTKSISDMLLKTEMLLKQYFAPYNENLAKLMKDNAFLWR